MTCPRCGCSSHRHAPSVTRGTTGRLEDTGWTVCLTANCPCRIDRRPLDPC